MPDMAARISDSAAHRAAMTLEAPYYAPDARLQVYQGAPHGMFVRQNGGNRRVALRVIQEG